MSIVSKSVSSSEAVHILSMFERLTGFSEEVDV